VHSAVAGEAELVSVVPDNALSAIMADNALSAIMADNALSAIMAVASLGEGRDSTIHGKDPFLVKERQ